MKTRIIIFTILAILSAGCRTYTDIDPDPPVQTTDYLCFTAGADGAGITLLINDKANVNTQFEYSADKENWTPLRIVDRIPDTVRLAKAGDKVYFRNVGKVKTLSTANDEHQLLTTTTFSFSKKKIAASGNVLSLLDKDCPDDMELGEYALANLFHSCTSLTSAPSLPATVLSIGCYENMFYGCTALVNVPSDLPARTLLRESYYGMFTGCKSLETAPAIAATTLADACCYSMFDHCTKLKKAPDLLAEKVAAQSYVHMFNSCTSLEMAPEISAKESGTYGFAYMFYGCKALKNAPELSVTAFNGEYCYCGMFFGCSGLTQAPSLPMKALSKGCYHQMFLNCTSLENAPDLPAETLAAGCYGSMFQGCTSLKHIKVGFKDWGDGSITRDWVKDVPSLGVFECPEALEEKYGKDYIPENWEIIK